MIPRNPAISCEVGEEEGKMKFNRGFPLEVRHGFLDFWISTLAKFGQYQLLAQHISSWHIGDEVDLSKHFRLLFHIVSMSINSIFPSIPIYSHCFL